jgi:hypothetical protein
MWCSDRGSKIWGLFRYDSIPLDNSPVKDLPFDDSYLVSKWKFKLAVWEFGANESGGRHLHGLPRNLHWCRAPYWPLIIPLNIFSAYLILWKPRQAPTTEPTTRPTPD